MEKINEINEHTLYPISIGAAMLGTGGGGDPKIGYLMAKQAIEQNGPVKLVSVDDIADDAVVASLSMMGAPSVALEKIPNGAEFDLLYDQLESTFNTKIEYLYPIEAGGINSMIPIIAAAQNQVPILDADTMGRAFPELQMITLSLFDIKAFPIILANDLLETKVVNASTYQELEVLAREWTIVNGGHIAVGDGLISGAQIKQAGIRDIVSLSYHLGDIVLNQTKPLDKLKESGLKLLFKAKITDVERKTEGGFNRGKVKLLGIEEDADEQFELQLQNENTAVFKENKLLCSVPDLIMVLDIQTLMPITTDSYKYGQRVVVAAMRSDQKWKLPQGIKLVGPRAFGYDFDYQETLLEDK